MIQNEKFESSTVKKVILYSPLDWGLGHTTRSIPLIKEFIIQGFDIVIACNSIQKRLLEAEFPHLRYVLLEGYNIKYSNNRYQTRLKLLFQVPNILIRIKFEHSWISDFFSKNTVDYVFSDNRYGFWHPSLPSIFITHQLQARTGSGKIADKLLQRLLYKWINKFTECWIPDYKSEPFISGTLAHPDILPATPLKYIGGLSRFTLQPASIKYDALILLSGPEPQRTIIESIIISSIKNSSMKFVLVRGLPSTATMISENNLLALNHAPAHELNKLILESSFVISRSGYTTVMDLLKLKKKMILIPTPGQPEQEYLGSYLSEKKLALTINQEQFSVPSALALAEGFEYTFLAKKMDDYKAVVREFISNYK